jgi:hypothetical protein
MSVIGRILPSCLFLVAAVLTGVLLVAPPG